jgi:hypothetical protein
MVLKVFRWSPGFRERIQRFWVPAKEGMTVLDALVDAQRRLDPTLAFRYACRVGMCGSCGMVVNGRERWACRTLLKSLKTRIVTVRPLYHFPLVRDLVVDLAPLAEQTARVGAPSGQRSGGLRCRGSGHRRAPPGRRRHRVHRLRHVRVGVHHGGERRALPGPGRAEPALHGGHGQPGRGAR